MGTWQAVFQEGVAKRDSKVTQTLWLSELTSHLMRTQEFWYPQSKYFIGLKMATSRPKDKGREECGILSHRQYIAFFSLRNLKNSFTQETGRYTRKSLKNSF